MKHKVLRFTVIEGPLYSIMGEDSELNVFDSEVVAVTPEGLFGCTFFVSGYHLDEENFAHPNRNYKNDCEAIIKTLSPVKEIDTELGWYPIPLPPSLEERLAHEAEMEARDRAGERHPLFLAQLPGFVEAGYKMSEAEERALSRYNE
jgi:hypothetical protein